MILLLGLVFYPVIWTIRLSFDTVAGSSRREWVGFENYTTLFTEDRRFLNLHEFPPEGAWSTTCSGSCCTRRSAWPSAC